MQEGLLLIAYSCTLKIMINLYARVAFVDIIIGVEISENNKITYIDKLETFRFMYFALEV